MGKTQILPGVWLCILLASSVCSRALNPSLDISQYAHTAWKTREGFTKGSIFAIAQTPDGYLWLGTEFGLVRFDGVHAIPWQPPNGEQLPSSFIHNLLAARDGTLWIGTYKGLASWKGGKLKKYSEVGGSRVSSLLQDAEGAIWVGLTDPGKLCAIRATGTKCYGTENFGWTVPALYQDPKGSLWVAAQTGLWRWAPGHPEHYRLADVPTEATAMTAGDEGALLIASAASKAQMSPVDTSVEGLKELADSKVGRYAIPGGAGNFRPIRLFRSSDGSLWIGTVRGLLHVHEGRVDRFTETDGLSGNIISSIFEDREGDVWVSTETGLDRFREFAVPTITIKQGLSMDAVVAVEAVQDGSIWVATPDGLNRWQEGSFTIYGERGVQAQNRGINEEEVKARVMEIANSGLVGVVYSLGQDDRGRLWAGGSQGVFYFDSGRFVPVPGLPGGGVLSIAGDSQGTVWISKNDSLFSATPEGAVRRIPWAQLGRTDAADALLPDRLHGGMWLGFPGGGIAYLKDNQVRATYGPANGLGRGAVMDLQVGSDGALWAGTEGGLSRVKDGVVTTLASSNGLPCDAVQWSIEDNDHSFWLYMPCGLVRIDHSEIDAWVRDSKRSVKTTVFDGSDGVWSRGLPGHSRNVAKSPDGRIWFTSPDGVSIIDPRHLPFNKLPPPVYVDHITADGKDYDPSPGVRLPPLIRDLSIDYTALSLVVPEKVRFRFKLEPQDQDWREVVNVRNVQYSNLGPGDYRFRVIASNNSGVWNKEGASLGFSIAPAYYQTTWFRGLCMLTILALLWIIYQVRVRSLNRRQALLEENQTLLQKQQTMLVRDKEVLEQHHSEIRALNEQMVKAQEAERIRISGELHDGILQQITSFTLRLAKVRRQVPPDSEAIETVNGLQQQLIQVGTDIRHLSHELHPALLQDAGLPAALSAYCDEFSNVRGLRVSCETDHSVEALSPGAALCLYRIAQESLGNAAKHSKANEVEVRLTRVDGRVCLSVSDDGVGCPADQVGKSGGLGLISMRERVLQLDGTFEFDSEPGNGTSVRVTVPFRPVS